MEPVIAPAMELAAAAAVAPVDSAYVERASIGEKSGTGASICGGEKAMSNTLYAEYNAAIGAVMAARKVYTDACDKQGVDSWGAEQAQEHLTREIEHRDEVRERYDGVGRGRPPGERDG